MRIFVYYNFHKKRWSLKSLQHGLHKNRVVMHADRVALSDCSFKVSEAGRKRVLLSGHKNVHAGVAGTLINAQGVTYSLILSDDEIADLRVYESSSVELPSCVRDTATATYNPFKGPHFVYFDEGEAIPLISASKTVLTVEEVGELDEKGQRFKTKVLVENPSSDSAPLISRAA